MPYKVEVDRSKCIGCGTCASICDNFQLVDGKSRPKKTKVDEVGCNKKAEQTCPVGAIKVTQVK